MTEPYFTIVNPAAGGGRCQKLSGEALERLRQKGLELEVHHTRSPGHATELARRAREAGHRRFLSVGGDGTSYEVVNGLFPNTTDDAPVLAILPLGTGNSFLRDFGIKSTDDALHALMNGTREQSCDVVRATHDRGALHYINILSVGFSAEAGELTNRRFKPYGVAGYVAAVLLTAARLKRPIFPFRVDEGDLDRRPVVLLSFSNSRYTAGTMMMAPEADVSDGALDVIRIGAMGRTAFVKSFPRIFVGSHVQHEQVEQRRAQSVALELDGPVDVMVDGEVEKLILRKLDVLPGALKVMA